MWIQPHPEPSSHQVSSVVGGLYIMNPKPIAQTIMNGVAQPVLVAFAQERLPARIILNIPVHQRVVT